MVRLGFDEARLASQDAAPASPADLVMMLSHGVGGWQGRGTGTNERTMDDDSAAPASPPDDSDMRVHSRDIVEATREATALPITPARSMFVRNHQPAPVQRPDVDPMRWPVTFDGVLVPLTLPLKDLLAFGTTTVTCVVQCAGNGRSFFAQEAPGTPWGVGGAANVTFTGIPLHLVVAGLGGGTGGPRFITASGGDALPPGCRPNRRVERSVPVAALKDAILAFAMNGEPLCVRHGGPVRLVVPGYYAVNFVKYVRRVALTREESDADIHRIDYRVRPVGVEPGPEHPTLWEMPAKSWIASAQAVAPRRFEVKGVAFGGMSAAALVEVTVDDGVTWMRAELDGPDLGRHAWRAFRAALHLPRGTHRVASRVTLEDGSVQPAEVAANAQGFGHNGWRGHALGVFVD